MTLFHLPAGYFKQTELSRRGWTPSLIRELLGDPDAKKKNPCYRSAAPMKLYDANRVAAVEASDQWASLAEKVSTKKRAAEKAVQTKRDRLFSYVDQLVILVPVMSLGQVKERACDNFNRFKEEIACERDDYDWQPAKVDSSQEFLERIAVNYLRHRLTKYEQELNNVFGKVGVREAYDAINQKVYDAIAKAYPELAAECQRQLNRKCQGTIQAVRQPVSLQVSDAPMPADCPFD